MVCRPGCGACCIAASISRPLPGMPNGKPAGVVCVNLDLASKRCGVWGTDEYPETCRQFLAEPDVCGESAEQALRLIENMEQLTRVTTQTGR
jgi:Fe-S-cluster containining protein